MLEPTTWMNQVPVYKDRTIPWRTMVIAQRESSGETVVILGDEPKFDDPATEAVRRSTVLECIDIVRTGLTGKGLNTLDWQVWGPT